MIALIQRVTEASVEVDSQIVAQIKGGMLALVGIEKDDEKGCAVRLFERLIGYRIFADPAGKMNLSLSDIKGEVLLVPQFTLAADTQKGRRPSFSTAASPGHGALLFDYLVQHATAHYPHVAVGQFGADMQVRLCNDGPVTFWLKS